MKLLDLAVQDDGRPEGVGFDVVGELVPACLDLQTKLRGRAQQKFRLPGGEIGDELPKQEEHNECKDDAGPACMSVP